MSFHVGQKVVCVSDKFIRKPRDTEIYPNLGEVYTVRDINYYEGRIFLRLVEIVNAPDLYAEDVFLTECCFRGRNFRPVVERKTDISIFQRMLIPSKVSA